MKLLLCSAGAAALLTAALAGNPLTPAGTDAVPAALPAPAPASVPDAPAAVPVPAAAAPRKIELPAETGTYRQAPGVELAQAFCLTCHSVEYCELQPPSAEKYWDATVKKMKDKFGATIPDEAIAPLVDYLTRAYGKK